jgi:hypothetical protein
MKRHLGRFLFVVGPLAALLSGVPLTRAETGDLKLELVGPFAICEEATDLEIRIPSLKDTHGVPGFRSSFSEKPLDYSGGYAGVQSLDMLGLKPATGHTFGSMTVVPTGPLPNGGALYWEVPTTALACSGTPGTVSFRVPLPDEIRPEAPAISESDWVLDNKGNPTGVLRPTTGAGPHGRYATRIVLRYSSAQLETAIVSQGGGKFWDPQLVGLGAEAKITLEADPFPQSYPVISHLQSAIAFEQVSEMVLVGDARHLCFDTDATCPMALMDNPVMKRHVDMSTSAKDCHAPVFWACKKNSNVCK